MHARTTAPTPPLSATATESRLWSPGAGLPYWSYSCTCAGGGGGGAGLGPRVQGCRTGHTAAPDPGVYATAPAATPATAPATSPAAAPAVALLQPLLLPKQLSKQPAIICHPTPHREPEVVPRRDVARAGEGASGDVGGAPSHGEEQRGSQGYVTVEGVIVQQGQAVVTGK